MEKTIVSGSRKLIVSSTDNTIAAITRSGLMPTMKISFNKEYVVKVNKTTISTTTIDMLVACLNNDAMVFDTVYNHIIRFNDNYGYKITKAYFYSLFNDNLDSFVALFDNSDSKTRQIIIRDHCCDDHTGKMTGMISYSTLVLFNKFCIARMKQNKAVCKHCFAARQLGIYVDQLAKLARAHYIATMCRWNISDIPFIDYRKYPYFRLESFGDINNTLQVENYNTFARVNAQNGIMTTLWTKNPGIIQKAIDNGMILSEYLTIGLSSLELNKPELEKALRYKFIKFLFTVYTPEYISENNITINCGGRECLKCLKCYEYAANNDQLVIINEMLK